MKRSKKMINNRLITYLFISCVSIFMACKASATEIKGKLEYITVHSDSVVLKTNSSESYSPAACVEQDKKGIASLSLTTQAGRAMYAVVMAASDGQKPVVIQYSGQCNELSGIESIASITVTDLANTVSSGSGQSKSLKLVGRAFSFKTREYDTRCNVTVTSKNEKNEDYVFVTHANGDTTCNCRDSKAEWITYLHEDDGGNNWNAFGPLGRGAMLNCYIEE